MRIQTRLFLGTATMVLALMALQWWLYARQLRAIEEDLARVATSVGKEILSGDLNMFVEHFPSAPDKDVELAWVTRNAGDVETLDGHFLVSDGSQPPVMMVAEGSEVEVKRIVKQKVENEAGGPETTTVIEDTYEWKVEGEGPEEDIELLADDHTRRVVAFVGNPPKVKHLTVTVEGAEVTGDRVLVVRDHDRHLRRIPIPVNESVERVQATMQKGAAVGGLLLVVGLVGSAVLSRRLTHPLRALADGAEALGHGDLGVQVPVSASGEVGELQRAFNRMSDRLAELEAERDEWSKREHLAQLGDLSRGLAHTLRNPLHTLGLAVEELAEAEGDRRGLVATSRTQIRRIDRWLRSFLALGAEESAQAEDVDLAELARAVALETVQQGKEVRVESLDDELHVRVVPGVVRAALANLVENAADVSPEGQAVLVRVSREDDRAVIRVVDRGPGLPDEVRQRLFSPHVTTKVGGSGMGLFLARQLVVGMHGGRLEIEDGEGGGTVATVLLPLTEPEASGGTTNGE
jgi:signal transduction histidine kinase